MNQKSNGTHLEFQFSLKEWRHTLGVCIFQHVGHATVDTGKETINQHVVNVVDVRLPCVGGWVCLEQLAVFL